MAIVDRSTAIGSNRPETFVSIDFGFDISTAPNGHHCVWDSSSHSPNHGQVVRVMFGDLSSSTIESEVREDTAISKPNLSLKDSCVLPQVQK